MKFNRKGEEYEDLQDLWYWRDKIVTEEMYYVLTDYRNFLYHSFMTDPQIGVEPTRVQYDIAEFLQHGPNKKAILSYRGIGKSKMTNDFARWLSIRDPNERHLILAANKDEAVKNATYIKNMLRIDPLCDHIRPGMNPLDDRNSVQSFTIDSAPLEVAPSYRSIGIFGTVTGNRATNVIFDDVEVPNNIKTPQGRHQLSEAVTEGADVIKASKDESFGRITYLGTPHSLDSLYNKLDERGYEVRIWPAYYPTKEKMYYYINKLAPMLKEDIEKKPELILPSNGIDFTYGELTDPERHTDASLTSKMKEKGKTGFEMQYMLNTALADTMKFPLKYSDLIVDTLDINTAHGRYMWAKDDRYILDDVPNLGIDADYFYKCATKSDDIFDYEGSLMTIDAAGFGKDEMAYTITKMLNGYIFLFKVGGVMKPDRDSILELAKIAKKYNVNTISIESNNNGSTVAELYKEIGLPIHNCEIHQKASTSKKEIRIIDNLEPLMNNHKLIVDKDCIIDDAENLPVGYEKDKLVYSLFYQMSRMTFESGNLVHDDRIDALSMAVEYWREWLGRDASKAEAHKLNEKKDAEIKMFIEGGSHLLLNGEAPQLNSDGWFENDFDSLGINDDFF